MLNPGFSTLKLHTWEYLLPGVAFLVAFALRYHFLVTYSYPLMIHEQDAVGYMEVAKSILQLRLPECYRTATRLSDRHLIICPSPNRIGICCASCLRFHGCHDRGAALFHRSDIPVPCRIFRGLPSLGMLFLQSCIFSFTTQPVELPLLPPFGRYLSASGA